MRLTERNCVAIGMNELRQMCSAQHYQRHSNGITAAECEQPACAEVNEILRLYEHSLRPYQLLVADWHYVSAFMVCPYCGESDHGVTTDDTSARKQGESAQCNECGREFIVPHIPGLIR